MFPRHPSFRAEAAGNSKCSKLKKKKYYSNVLPPSSCGSVREERLEDVFDTSIESGRRQRRPGDWGGVRNRGLDKGGGDGIARAAKTLGRDAVTSVMYSMALQPITFFYECIEMFPMIFEAIVPGGAS